MVMEGGPTDVTDGADEEVIADEPGGPSSALMVAELSLSMLRRLPWEADSGLLEAREEEGGRPEAPGVVLSVSLPPALCDGSPGGGSGGRDREREM